MKKKYQLKQTSINKLTFAGDTGDSLTGAWGHVSSISVDMDSFKLGATFMKNYFENLLSIFSISIIIVTLPSLVLWL